MSASAKSSRSDRTATNQAAGAAGSRAKGGRPNSQGGRPGGGQGGANSGQGGRPNSQGGRAKSGQAGRANSGQGGQPGRNGRGGPPADQRGAGQTGRPARGGQGGRQASQATAARPPVAPAEQPGVSWWRLWTWPRVMGWLPFTTLVLAVLGLADSAYQVYTHYSGTGLLGCSATGDSCVAVQTSSYAYIFGIPVAVFGLAFYVFMVAACSPWAWRAKLPAVRLVRLASVIVGILFVLYLVYREVISLGKICAYCTSVHIITFILFALIVFNAAGAMSAPADSPRPARR
jgi:uncharacterized membrane protein